MRELGRSLGQFITGIVRRFYLWLFQLVLDPLDLLGKLGVPVAIADWLALLAIGGGLFLAAFLTYHELRRTKSFAGSISVTAAPGSSVVVAPNAQTVTMPAPSRTRVKGPSFVQGQTDLWDRDRQGR